MTQSLLQQMQEVQTEIEQKQAEILAAQTLDDKMVLSQELDRLQHKLNEYRGKYYTWQHNEIKKLEQQSYGQ